MNFFIISGAPNTGKTTTIREVYNNILLPKAESIDGDKDVPRKKDFTRTLTVNGKKILIHSATDDSYNIDLLFDNISIDIDIVITSCRDLYTPREYFHSKLAEYQNENKITIISEEFPLAKITRRSDWDKAYSWYSSKCMLLIEKILSSTPYNI